MNSVDSSCFSPILLADRAVESNSKELSLVVFSHPGFLPTRYWSYVRENPDLRDLFVKTFGSQKEARQLFHGNIKKSQKDLDALVIARQVEEATDGTRTTDTPVQEVCDHLERPLKKRRLAEIRAPFRYLILIISSLC